VPVEILVRRSAAKLVDGATRREVKARTRVALAALGRGNDTVVLLLTDDVEIRDLNQRFRHLDRATDVLSFPCEPQPGAGQRLGDIAVSVTTALRRAGQRRLRAELERLAIHGLCHLAGHDHKRKAEAKVMFSLERRLRSLPAP
jgi:probable rRNA maturation factor